MYLFLYLYLFAVSSESSVENCTAKGQPPARSNPLWKVKTRKLEKLQQTCLAACLAACLPGCHFRCAAKEFVYFCTVQSRWRCHRGQKRGRRECVRCRGASRIYLHLAHMAWDGGESKSLLWLAIICHFNVKVKVDSQQQTKLDSCLSVRMSLRLSVCSSLCLSQSEALWSQRTWACGSH